MAIDLSFLLGRRFAAQSLFKKSARFDYRLGIDAVLCQKPFLLRHL